MLTHVKRSSIATVLRRIASSVEDLKQMLQDVKEIGEMAKGNQELMRKVLDVKRQTERILQDQKGTLINHA